MSAPPTMSEPLAPIPLNAAPPVADAPHRHDHGAGRDDAPLVFSASPLVLGAGSRLAVAACAAALLWATVGWALA